MPHRLTLYAWLDDSSYPASARGFARLSARHNQGEGHDPRSSSRCRRSVTLVPVDNLRAIGGPHTLMAHHVPERLVEKTNAERLTDVPGVQVQYQEPTVLLAIPIQDVKTLLEELALAVHRHPPLPELVDVIQFEHDGQGVQYLGGHSCGGPMLAVPTVVRPGVRAMTQQCF